MVCSKRRNILLTLKEQNVNSCTTIKQIYNAKSAYRSLIRGSDTEILKDEDMVCDIFWCHPDIVKLCNACNLNHFRCGCVMRTTHDLLYACELSKYVIGNIPLDSIHMLWRRLSFSDQGLSEPQVTITEEMKTISKRFEELDVCGKVILKSKLREIAYPDQNSMCSPPEKVNTKGAHKKSMNRNQRSQSMIRLTRSMLMLYIMCKIRSASSSDQAIPRRTMPMLDQFHPFIHNFIENIVDVKANCNFGYHAIAALLGMGEDSWSLVRNHLLKELGKWSNEYINLFGGTERFEELRRSLLVDELSMVTMDKWMDITEMRYVIASRYNVILVSLSLKQSMTFFPLRSQPPTDSSVLRKICIGHIYDNHFVQVDSR
ncbi:hypothetical protein GmHk_02G004807 [Glycine max]|nr:hypothetical protein GmHk_02G004807 [Glycine max]